MKIKKTVFFSLLLAMTVFFVASWGLSAKAHTFYQEDTPKTPAAETDIPPEEQVANTLGIILGGIAILVAIGVGAGFNYAAYRKKYTTNQSN